MAFKTLLLWGVGSPIITNRPHSFQNTIILECGLSDHHKMTITVLKKYVPKQTPNLIKYRDYKNFNDQNFRQELKYNFLNIMDNMSYDNFESTFKDTLYKHVPNKD